MTAAANATIATVTAAAADEGKPHAEYVILVDEHDNPIGMEEKVRCHLPDGKLHRAFTALLFEEKSGGLILGRRAGEKMLWPGYWDGTFASHPRESETYVSSCRRRMPEELGITAEFDYLHKFEYHVPYRDIGSENEICGTLVGTIRDASDVVQVRGEIDGVRTASAGQMAADAAENPGAYCPWMLVALYMLDRSDRAALEKHSGILDPWMAKEVKDSLLGAISSHMPRESWRLVGQ